MKPKNGMYIEGIDEAVDFLERELPEQTDNLLRSLVQSLAVDVAKLVRKNITAAGLVAEGVLKKSIKAKRRKVRKGERPYSDVIGAFYWLFHEYGTQGGNKLPEQPILRPAMDQVNANMDELIGKKLQQRMKSLTKRLRKKRTGN